MNERDPWQNKLISLLRYAISEESLVMDVLEGSVQELSFEGRSLLFVIDFMTILAYIILAYIILA